MSLRYLFHYIHIRIYLIGWFEVFNFFSFLVEKSISPLCRINSLSHTNRTRIAGVTAAIPLPPELFRSGLKSLIDYSFLLLKSSVIISYEKKTFIDSACGFKTIITVYNKSTIQMYLQTKSETYYWHNYVCICLHGVKKGMHNELIM